MKKTVFLFVICFFVFSAAFCDNYRDYLNEKEAKKVSEIDKEREKAENRYSESVKKALEEKDRTMAKLNEEEQKIADDVSERTGNRYFDISGKKSSVSYEKTIVTKGMAAVINNDFASARDKACLDAQIKALEEIVGVFLDQESVAAGDYEIRQRIFSKSKGYISSSAIIEGSEKTEKFEDAVILSLECRSTVNVSQVLETLEDIKEVYNKLNRPRFIIQARSVSNNGENKEVSLIENMFAEKLINMGFDVVNRRAVLNNIDGRFITNYNDNLKKQKIRISVNIDSAVISRTKQGEGIRRPKNANDTISIVTDLLDFLNRSTVTATTASALSVQIVDLKTLTPIYSENTELTGSKAAVLKDPGDQIVKTLENTAEKFFKENRDKITQTLFATWVDSMYQNDFYVTVKNIEYEEIGDILDIIPEVHRFCKGVSKAKYREGAARFSVYTKAELQDLAKDLKNIEIGGKKLKLISADEDLETAEYILE